MSACIFCKIINKEIKSFIVAENDLALAFLDVNPISDGHTLIIPKKHTCDLNTCDRNSLGAVFELAQEVARNIEASSLNPWGFNFLSNQGNIAGQEVLHFHVHVIPKYAKNKGFAFNVSKDTLQDLNYVLECIKK